MRTNIAVREVDKEVFRKFKAKTIEEDMKLGETLTLAMKFWLIQKSKRANPKTLLEIKPFDWGKENENASERIDEFLYGKKK
jgi:hypothetical protein